jgi:endonuclease-8
MPEGDTIFRAAQALHRALAGHVVVRFDSMFPALTRVHDDEPLTGQTIEQVASAGKHILMQFSGGQLLRTHMRMNGSWHIYRPGERWKRPRRDMRIVVATDRYEAVGFNIPVAEFIRQDRLGKHRELSSLGPDLLGRELDTTAAIRRIRARGSTPIADALLNQRVVAGIGNVYKSEVLFACRIDPFAPIDRLTDAQLTCLLDTARRFLRANVSTGLRPMTTYTGFRRTTGRDNPADRLWVYGRAGLPCRKCGTPIAIRKHGTDARLTYWCSQCQAPRSGGSE